MAKQQTELMKGTLDLLVLKTLALEPRHGVGVADRIEQITRGAFLVKPGSLFPALHRLEQDGYIAGTWSETPEGRRAKFLYLIPTFQNPSGITLTTPRRERIIDICHRHDLLMVEDNPYAQIRFEGEPVPPLRSLTDEKIIYLGTLSKVISPGMRTGWIGRRIPA